MKNKIAVRVFMSFVTPLLLMFILLWLLGSFTTSNALAEQTVTIYPPSYDPITSTFSVYLPLVQRSITPTVLASPCSIAPTLVSPPDKSSLNTLIPQFEYIEETEPVSYTKLTIADNPAFDMPIQYSVGSSGKGIGDLTLFGNLKAGTTYYWRVNDVCGAANSPFSSVFSFTTGSNGTILPAPNLVSPADGTTNVGEEMTFTWDAVGGATGYEPYVCEKQGNCTLSFTPATTETFYLNPNTEYRWHVFAYNDYAYGNQSEEWTFTTGSFSAGK
jgi:hypothetical protein